LRIFEQLPPPVPVMALGWVEPDRARWRGAGRGDPLGKAFARVERLTI
jgi:hypothetical protein